jgi:sterol desaturase/sphingolipid hydroxylase (fatty acid hydroxylase superfamily)
MKEPQTRSSRPLPLPLRAALIAGTFILIVWHEWRRPLRGRAEAPLVHTARNVAVAAVGAATVHLLEAPIVGRIAAIVLRRRSGLLGRFALPVWVDVVAAVALMDYTLYIWHVLAHRVPWLWRFHQVHHADLDLDGSTALRFHFGELAVSIPWRVGQIALIGTTPLALSVWQTATLMSILFHHSNIRLSVESERQFARLVVTPRMHGIHHSIVRRETNSNWSSGLSLWDRIHGTLRLNVPQRELVIGVPALRSADDVSLPRMLRLPFASRQPDWLLPGNGEPDRRVAPVPPRQLLA